jgi:hypothetical protein
MSGTTFQMVKIVRGAVVDEQGDFLVLVDLQPSYLPLCTTSCCL